MTLDQLKKAVEDFFGDTSRSREETRDGLEEVSGQIEAFLDSLRDD